MTRPTPGGSGYPYSNLTAAIDDKQSPLRVYLDATYPHSRAVTTPHSMTSPPLAIPATAGVNPGTLGTAFDCLIALRYQPNTIPAAARHHAHSEGLLDRALRDAWTNILNAVAHDPTNTQAAAWAYALAVEAYRSPVMPYALDDLLDNEDVYTEHDLLAIAPPEALNDLHRLEALAETNLYPHLGPPPAPDPTIDHGWRRVASLSDPKPEPGQPARQFGPTFTASRLCNADADLINDGTLYEFKTRLGRKKPNGTRTDALPLIDLYQAVAYALFDTHDQYGIRHIAFYSARYGRHTRWALDDLLATLAGRVIDPAAERATLWRLLGGDTSP